MHAAHSIDEVHSAYRFADHSPIRRGGERDVAVERSPGAVASWRGKRECTEPEHDAAAGALHPRRLIPRFLSGDSRRSHGLVDYSRFGAFLRSGLAGARVGRNRRPGPDQYGCAAVLAKVWELGPVLNEAVIASGWDLYGLLQPKFGPDVSQAADLAYGPEDLQRLDVCVPVPKPVRPAPVVLFVHGGGYVGGTKTLPGTPFNGHIGRFFARHGIVGVVMTYRLAPQHR